MIYNFTSDSVVNYKCHFILDDDEVAAHNYRYDDDVCAIFRLKKMWLWLKNSKEV